MKKYLIVLVLLSSNLWANENACESFVPADVNADYMTVNGNCLILNDVELSELAYEESKTLHIKELGGLVLGVKKGEEVALLIDEDWFYVLDPSNEGWFEKAFTIIGFGLAAESYRSSNRAEREAERFRSEQRERQRSADRQKSVDDTFRRVEEAAKNLPENHKPIDITPTRS